MRGDVLKVFYTGASGDGLSIDSDLKQRAKDAYTLTGIAGRYPEVDTALVTKAAGAQKALDEANALSRRNRSRREATQTPNCPAPSKTCTPR